MSEGTILPDDSAWEGKINERVSNLVKEQEAIKLSLREDYVTKDEFGTYKRIFWLFLGAVGSIATMALAKAVS